MATVYFCDYGFEGKGKKVGSVEEIKALVESWANDGFFTHYLGNNVWVIEM